MQKYDIFISHSSSDSKYAKDICAFLEARGIKCWMAPRDIKPGASYPTEITRGIKKCDTFLVLLTKDSVNSPHVNTETDIAFNANKQIIPFFVDKVELGDSMSYYLARKQWILGYKDYGQSLEDLFNVLNPIVSSLPKNEVPHHETSTGTKCQSETLCENVKSFLLKNKNNKSYLIIIIAFIIVLIIAWNYYSNQKNSSNEEIFDAVVEVVDESYDTNAMVGEAENDHPNHANVEGEAEGGQNLQSITTINGKECTAYWEIDNNDYSIKITGNIDFRGNNIEPFYCILWLHKRSLEGVVEDMDGANIGYFKGKIKSTAIGHIISGDFHIHNDNDSYITLKCDVEIESNKAIDFIFNKEMNTND